MASITSHNPKSSFSCQNAAQSCSRYDNDNGFVSGILVRGWLTHTLSRAQRLHELSTGVKAACIHPGRCLQSHERQNSHSVSISELIASKLQLSAIATEWFQGHHKDHSVKASSHLKHDTNDAQLTASFPPRPPLSVLYPIYSFLKSSPTPNR